MKRLMPTSPVARDLNLVRNAKPLWSRLGTVLALPFIGLDLWTNQLFGFSFFGTLSHGKPDFATLKKAPRFPKPIAYPKPDGTLTFDRFPVSLCQIPTMKRISRCIWCCAIPQFPLR